RPIWSNAAKFASSPKKSQTATSASTIQLAARFAWGNSASLSSAFFASASRPSASAKSKTNRSSFRSLMKYYTGTEVLRVLYPQAERSDQVDSGERGITQILRSRHPAGAEYDVQTLTAILSAAKNISLALTIVLLLIAFIALLIS